MRLGHTPVVARSHPDAPPCPTMPHHHPHLQQGAAVGREPQALEQLGHPGADVQAAGVEEKVQNRGERVGVGIGMLPCASNPPSPAANKGRMEAPTKRAPTSPGGLPGVRPRRAPPPLGPGQAPLGQPPLEGSGGPRQRHHPEPCPRGRRGRLWPPSPAGPAAVLQKAGRLRRG